MGKTPVEARRFRRASREERVRGQASRPHVWFRIQLTEDFNKLFISVYDAYTHDICVIVFVYIIYLYIMHIGSSAVLRKLKVSN